MHGKWVIERQVGEPGASDEFEPLLETEDAADAISAIREVLASGFGGAVVQIVRLPGATGWLRRFLGGPEEAAAFMMLFHGADGGFTATILDDAGSEHLLVDDRGREKVVGLAEACAIAADGIRAMKPSSAFEWRFTP